MKTLSRVRQLVKSTAIISLGSFFPRFAGLIILPILTGHLTSVEYGTYDLILTLVSLLLPIITVKVETAAFRFLLEAGNDKERITSIITNVFIISMFSVFILIFCAIYVYKYRNVETIFFIILYLFMQIILNNTQQILRGLSKNFLYSFTAIINTFTNLILIIVFIAKYNKGLYGVLLSGSIAMAIASLIGIILGKLYKYIRIRSISLMVIKHMLIYSWPMIPNTLANWIMSISDRLIVTAFLGVEMNAIYAVANKIPSIFSSFQTTLSSAWFENASIASKDSDVEEYYSTIFSVVYYGLTGFMCILIGFLPLIFFILIKGNYKMSYIQIPILMLGYFYSAIASIIGGIYIAFKETKKLAYTTVVASIINIVINVCFIKKMGLYAASISTVIACLVNMIYRMYDVRNICILKYNKVKIVICNILLVAMIVLCWIDNDFLNVMNVVIGIGSAIILNRQLIILLLRKYHMKSRLKRNK